MRRVHVLLRAAHTCAGRHRPFAKRLLCRWCRCRCVVNCKLSSLLLLDCGRCSPSLTGRCPRPADVCQLHRRRCQRYVCVGLHPPRRSGQDPDAAAGGRQEGCHRCLCRQRPGETKVLFGQWEGLRQVPTTACDSGRKLCCMYIVDCSLAPGAAVQTSLLQCCTEAFLGLPTADLLRRV